MYIPPELVQSPIHHSNSLAVDWKIKKHPKTFELFVGFPCAYTPRKAQANNTAQNQLHATFLHKTSAASPASLRCHRLLQDDCCDDVPFLQHLFLRRAAEMRLEFVPSDESILVRIEALKDSPVWVEASLPC